MPNLKQKVIRHNKKVILADNLQPLGACNCTAVIDGECQTKGVIYRAEVISQNFGTETYTGLTKNTFKTRFYKHRESFKTRSSENSTTLSSHIWKLKDRGDTFNINWSIVDKGTPSTLLLGYVVCAIRRSTI